MRRPKVHHRPGGQPHPSSTSLSRLHLFTTIASIPATSPSWPSPPPRTNAPAPPSTTRPRTRRAPYIVGAGLPAKPRQSPKATNHTLITRRHPNHPVIARSQATKRSPEPTHAADPSSAAAAPPRHPGHSTTPPRHPGRSAAKSRDLPRMGSHSHCAIAGQYRSRITASPFPG